MCGSSLLEPTWVSERSSENSEPAPGLSLHVPEIPSPNQESPLNLLDPGSSTPDRETCGLDEALRLLDAVLTPVKPFNSKEVSPRIQPTDEVDCLNLQASPLPDSPPSPPRLAFFTFERPGTPEVIDPPESKRPIRERIQAEWSDSHLAQHRTDPSLGDRRRTRPPPRWSPRKKQALHRVFGPSAAPNTSAAPALPQQAQRPKNYRTPKRLKSVIVKPDPPTANVIRQLFPEAFQANKRGKKTLKGS